MGILDRHLFLDRPGRPGRHPDALIDSLLDAPLFHGIDREEIVAVLEGFDEERFDTRHRITLQGLRGTDFYLITQGRARVLVDGAPVAALGAGDFFGEVGVLSDGQRTATVEAETPLTVLALPHRGLEAVLVQHPQLSVNVLRQVLERFRAVSAHDSRHVGSPGSLS